MKGLKKYTHAERQKVIEEIIPLVRRKFGDNLVALAAQGSFARADDTAYSDLELIAFVREMPGNKDLDGFGKIRDGLLVELIWTTRETYLRRTPDVTKEWFLSGSDVLLPIINEEFIRELSDYRVENLKEKCLAEAKNHWHEVQESTAKTLNAIAADNRDAVSLLLADMLIHMLIVLSFLNQTPYITFSKFIAQARAFKTKPAQFETLLDIMTTGKFQDLPLLEKTIEKVFSQFETIFEDAGVELYHDNINPSDEK
jgi:predicted nucleotidyltransferase